MDPIRLPLLDSQTHSSFSSNSVSSASLCVKRRREKEGSINYPPLKQRKVEPSVETLRSVLVDNLVKLGQALIRAGSFVELEQGSCKAFQYLTEAERCAVYYQWCCGLEALYEGASGSKRAEYNELLLHYAKNAGQQGYPYLEKALKQKLLLQKDILVVNGFLCAIEDPLVHDVLCLNLSQYIITHEIRSECDFKIETVLQWADTFADFSGAFRARAYAELAIAASRICEDKSQALVYANKSASPYRNAALLYMALQLFKPGAHANHLVYSDLGLTDKEAQETASSYLDAMDDSTLPVGWNPDVVGQPAWLQEMLHILGTGDFGNLFEAIGLDKNSYEINSSNADSSIYASLYPQNP